MNLKRYQFSKKAFASCIAMALVAEPLAATIMDTSSYFSAKAKQVKNEMKNWKKVYSSECKLTIEMPRVPEHLKQKMPMSSEAKELQYNVFVADHERKEVFMVLVAEYPGEVPKESAHQNLEHFLNTLMSQNPKNRLLFADLIDFKGHPGMDFFIRTDQVYFKGRAIQANNTLYLLALECEIPNYQEEHYNYFINSFQLHD